MSEQDRSSSDMHAALRAAADSFATPVDEPTMPNQSEQQVASAGGAIRYRFFGHTEVGLVREHNEDNFLVADLSSDSPIPKEDANASGTLGQRGLVLAVCDGMGGAAAGEVASQMAVDTLQELFRSDEPVTDRDSFARRLVRAIEEAGTRIFNSAKMDRTRRGMGTTSTVAGLVDKVLFVGQVGDSRAYVLRNGQLSLISKDQSLVNQLIEAGQLTEEEAEAFEHSNIILQALGTTEKVVVDLTFLELRREDRLMLCSDGLSGLVHPEMIKDVLATVPEPRDACLRLMELANNGGGHDNITCIVADFEGEGLLPATNAPPATYQQYPLPLGDDDTRDAHGRNTQGKLPAAKSGGEGRRSRSAMEHSAPAPEVPVSRFPWWFVVVVGLVLLAIALLAWRLEPKDESRAARPAATTTATTRPAGAPVELRIRTDANLAELFVDGLSYGDITAGSDVFVELTPGTYRLELRRDGTTLTSTNVVVRADSPADVLLSAPSVPEAAPSPTPTAAPSVPASAPSPTPTAAPSPTPAAAPSPRPAAAPSPTPAAAPRPLAPAVAPTAPRSSTPAGANPAAPRETPPAPAPSQPAERAASPEPRAPAPAPVSPSSPIQP